MIARRDEFELAVAFARLTNRGGVQVWMRWPGWSLHAGCDRCVGDGPDAPCWGVAGCHGYDRGCGCEICALLQLEDERAQAAGERAVLAEPLDVGPLRRELGPELGAGVAAVVPADDRGARPGQPGGQRAAAPG